MYDARSREAAAAGCTIGRWVIVMQYEFEVVIVGASFGGVAAALAVADARKNVCLIDAGTTVGGQATSQGVSRWDETSAAWWYRCSPRSDTY